MQRFRPLLRLILLPLLFLAAIPGSCGLRQVPLVPVTMPDRRSDRCPLRQGSFAEFKQIANALLYRSRFEESRDCYGMALREHQRMVRGYVRPEAAAGEPESSADVSGRPFDRVFVEVLGGQGGADQRPAAADLSDFDSLVQVNNRLLRDRVLELRRRRDELMADRLDNRDSWNQRSHYPQPRDPASTGWDEYDDLI